MPEAESMSDRSGPLCDIFLTEQRFAPLSARSATAAVALRMHCMSSSSDAFDVDTSTQLQLLGQRVRLQRELAEALSAQPVSHT